MGEIDKKGSYITKIPFSNIPYLQGAVCIKLDNKKVNDYIENKVSRC